MPEENSNFQNVNYTIASCQRGTSQGSYKIFLEDGSSFFISIDFFIANKLCKGLEVDSHLLTQLQEESLFVEAYSKAITLLARQLYSRFNLKRKLLSKGFSPEGIEKALDFLGEQGYIDDHKYATNWVLNRINNKLDSYSGLFAGLQRKGINTNIAIAVLNEFYTPEVRDKILHKAINKQLNQGKTEDKIIASLSRKGFNHSKIIFFLGTKQI